MNSRVLLIDSDPPDRGILRNRLSDVGHDVHEESSWEQGLMAAKDGMFDAIVVASRTEGVLLGKLMPALVSTLPIAATIPVLVYEARKGSDPSDMSLAMEAGADGFIEREELPALVACLESLMAQRQHLIQITERQRGLRHLQRTLQESPTVGPCTASIGGIEAVMLSSEEGIVLAGDAGAGRLVGNSPVGMAVSDAFPKLGLDRFVRSVGSTALVSEPFEQPAGLGPAGIPLELRIVPLLSDGQAEPLRMAIVTQKAVRSVTGDILPADSQWQLERTGGLRNAAAAGCGLNKFVGRSAQACAAREAALAASQHREPFLIMGPKGAGAKLLAKAIHSTANPFATLQVVHVGAVSPSWIQGALSPSSRISDWMKERTLLLVGVDQLSIEDQAALAQSPPPGRILMTSISPLSSLHPALADWIGTRQMQISSLVNRPADLPLLARNFIASKGGNAEISPGAIETLMRYPWPGNVAELESCLMAAYLEASMDFEIGASVMVGIEHLPDTIVGQHYGGVSGIVESTKILQPWDITDQDEIDFDLYERKAILRALDYCKNNRVACARMLRLGKSTLYRKLKRLGIDSDAECEDMQA
jgi:DNA-binding NtrC family response regulator